jgi:hypothetical protein
MMPDKLRRAYPVAAALVLAVRTLTGCSEQPDPLALPPAGSVLHGPE